MTGDELASQFTRRAMLMKALAIGSISPAVAGLLAACNPLGDDDNGENTGEMSAASTATETPRPAGPPAVASKGEAPTPTTPPATPILAATARPTSTPYPPDPAQHFQIASWLPFVSHNPHVGFGQRSWLGSRLVLEPLFEFDADLNPVILLAAEWSTFENGLLDPEGRWVTWKLRKGVAWHDGTPFTADDVITTWQFIVASNGAAEGTRTTGSVFELVDTIERIDDHTITIHFTRPNPNWIDIFRGGDGVILPAHIFEPLIGEFTSYEDEVNQEPVGTGPWKIVESNLSSSRARYERFNGYWDQDEQTFETVELQFLSGDPLSNARRVLESGDADYAPGLQVVDGEQLADMNSSNTDQLAVIPGLGIETLFLNFADPRGPGGQPRAEPGTPHRYFSNLTVRQAVSLAIPRDRLVEAYGSYSNEPFNYPLVAPEAYRGTGSMTAPNVDLARAMLDGIGFDGGNLLLQTSVDPNRQRAQEIIAEALEQIGFTVELKSVDAGVFFSLDPENPDTASHFYADMQFFTPAPPGSPYPLEWAERFRSDRIASSANNWTEPNISRYANPEFDSLHDRAKTEMGPVVQAGLWHRMMTILTEDAVIIPLIRRNGLAAISNRVIPAGFSPWAVAPSWNLQHWTVSP